VCHNWLESLAQQRATKIAAASVDFSWRGGVPNFFRQQWRDRVPAGVGGGSQWLRGLPLAFGKNTILSDIKRAATLLTLKKKLKTFLFSKHIC